MKLQDLDFRVWDISEKVFYDNLGLSILPSSSPSKSLRMDLAITFAKNLETACMLISNYEIELYSCIKDMHGNKLYENDIVAHMSGRAIEYHSVVKFNRNIGAFGLKGIEYFFNIPMRWIQELKSLAIYTRIPSY